MTTISPADLPKRLYIIARWQSDQDTEMTIQDFLREGRSFIPLFSSEAAFTDQIRGSGFERQGVEIDRKLLAGILRGDMMLMLDPGGADPCTLTVADLAS